jgi:hypothetical protein
MPNLRELVKISRENGLPLRVTEAATLSYGGVQVGRRDAGNAVGLSARVRLKVAPWRRQ